MTSSQLGDEGGGEHALEFGGVQRSRVLSCSLEGVQGGIEVARLAGDIASRCLVGGGGAGEGLDFLVVPLVGRSLGNVSATTYHSDIKTLFGLHMNSAGDFLHIGAGYIPSAARTG